MNPSTTTKITTVPMVSLIEIFSTGMCLSGDDYQCQFVLVLLNIDPIEEQLLKHVVPAKAYNAQHHLFIAFFRGNLSNVDGCALCLYFRIWNPGGIFFVGYLLPA